MLVEEAQISANVNHVNIGQILEFGEIEGSYFIAMEYLTWPSVAAISRRARSSNMLVPYPIAVEIVVQACEGLHAAHELRGPGGAHLGLVHRDVSPQNLLVGRDGVGKITDFGVARAEARISETRESHIKGKLPYMAPEQMTAAAVDRDGWFHTGDCFRQDEDGYFYFHYRDSELIKTSGYRVSPDEVETVLLDSGLVDEAMVTGDKQVFIRQLLTEALTAFKERGDIDA